MASARLATFAAAAAGPRTSTSQMSQTTLQTSGSGCARRQQSGAARPSRSSAVVAVLQRPMPTTREHHVSDGGAAHDDLKWPLLDDKDRFTGESGSRAGVVNGVGSVPGALEEHRRSLEELEDDGASPTLRGGMCASTSTDATDCDCPRCSSLSFKQDQFAQLVGAVLGDRAADVGSTRTRRRPKLCLDGAAESVVLVGEHGGFVWGAPGKYKVHKPGCHCPNCHKAKKLNEAGATLEVVPTEALLAPPPEAVPEGGEEQLHREQMRRKRISEANRGKTAWNKGLRHSEETKAKIRERTMQAMQSPELRKRLSEAAAAQRHTPETREKIKAAARVRAERRKYELCLIFAAALAWARVSRADRHLPGESWLGPRFLLPEKRSALRSGAQASRAPETRKQGSLPSIFSSRGPKSPEHRAKISASIRAKWRQPEYAAKLVGVPRTGRLPPSGARPFAAPGLARAKKPPPLTAEERKRREGMAAQARAILTQAEAAAAGLRAAAAAGAAVDPKMLADVEATVLQARGTLERLQVIRAAPPQQQKRAEAPPPPQQPARPQQAAVPAPAPRAPMLGGAAGGGVRKVWYNGRLVDSQQLMALQQDGAGGNSSGGGGSV